MLDRYMIRELATTYRMRVLTLLTSWRFVCLWIAAPFALCAVVNQVDFGWAGVPFSLACLANFVLITVFAIETKRRLPIVGRVKVSPWRFLLPQTTAAIFLAVFSTIPSDERWSLTIKAKGREYRVNLEGPIAGGEPVVIRLDLAE